MQKNLKLYYILTFVLVGVVLAWKTLSATFLGAGVNFVAMLVLLAIMLMFICTDKFVKSRTRDLFIVSSVFAGLELIVFLVLEIFNTNLTYNTLKGFNIYQSVISFLGLIFFAYVVFRFICEVKGKTFAFVETLLGNNKREKKIKKAKELTNGSLMEKPNKNKEVAEVSNTSSIQQPEKAVEPAIPQTQPNLIQQSTFVYKNDEDSEK